jgi:hypothetical protein
MTLKEVIEGGELKRTREGTIYTNLENIRGVNPLNSCPFGRTDLKATRVRYFFSEDEVLGLRGRDGEFIFYGEDYLPEDIEGMEFILMELYPAENKDGIPRKQYLDCFGENLRWLSFEFHE